MSGTRRSQGMTLPGAGQLLIIVAAICAAWLFWSESRERGLIPGIAPPGADATDRGSETNAVNSIDLPSVDQLLSELENPIDPAARRQALLQLSSIEPPALEALGAIRERLEDENAGVRYAAMVALRRVSQDREVVMSALPQMLADSSGLIRDLAARTLEDFGPASLPLAMDMLRSESPESRSRAVLVLRRIVRPDTFAEISDAIRRLSDDADADVRTDALVACLDWGSIDLTGIRLLLQTDRGVSPVFSRS